MTTTFSEIEELLKAREDEHLEFKEAKNQYDYDKLAKYCSALANEGGGKMVLGITDKMPRHIVGTQAFPNLHKIKSALIEALHLRIETDEISHPAGRVVIFTIPSRPFGIPIRYRGVYWMRRDEDVVEMTDDMIRGIFDEIRLDFSADIQSSATIDDLDSVAITELRIRWHRKSRIDRLLEISDEQLLADAELVLEGRVTNAALLLLGKQASLNKYLPQAETIFEFRSSEASGPAQRRSEFRTGFLLYQDELWTLINSRNDLQHFQVGLYKIPIQTFNESVVRGSCTKTPTCTKSLWSICAGWWAAQIVCAVAFCLMLLVSVVVGRTIPPLLNAAAYSVLVTEFSAVRSAEDVIIGNYPINIPTSFVIGWLNRGRAGNRSWEWSFLIAVELGGEIYPYASSKPHHINLWGEKNPARCCIRGVNDSIFWRWVFSEFDNNTNVAIPTRRSSSVGTNDEEISCGLTRVQVFIWRWGHSFSCDISAVLKFTSATVFQPLNSIKDENAKSQNSQYDLGAIIEPPSKTFLGYVLVLLGLVINYFGFCALYKGWYRLSHRLRHGRLGLCIGLLFIAASAFIIGHGFYLITK